MQISPDCQISRLLLVDQLADEQQPSLGRMLSENLSVIRSKDVIALEVDSLGVLSIPSTNEPLAEREEQISHLRIAHTPSIGEADFTRCMFRVETDAGQVCPSSCTAIAILTCIAPLAPGNPLWICD